jgi:two-component system, OmpR family, response regulator VicR
MTHASSLRPRRRGKRHQGPPPFGGYTNTTLPAQIVVESITDFAALCDANGRVTYVNPALAALLQDVPSLDVPLDEYAAAYRACRPDGQLYDPRELPLQAAALTQTPQRNAEILFRRPDGTTRLTIFNATPLYDEQGTLRGAVAIGRDVTDEYALAQAREDWLATAAHDLRGPVTAILGNLQLARRALSLILPDVPQLVASTQEWPRGSRARRAEWGRVGRAGGPTVSEAETGAGINRLGADNRGQDAAERHDTPMDGQGAQDRPAERKLVLIAEDEEPIAEALAMIAEDAGYAAMIATHGQQALDMARARRPALVITDLMMPYLDGQELIAALRADASRNHDNPPPIILMTAAGPRRAGRADADVVLRKPFNVADVEALLERFLGQAQQRGAPAPASDEA